MDPRITPYLIAALVVWAVYRRLRRSFGRQRVRDALMWLRIGILTAAAAAVTAATAHDVRLLAALLAGVACGAALGYVGLRYTRFEVQSDGRFYTPHTYIGVAVSALFFGRLLYRFLTVYNGTLPAASASHGFATAYQGPFTLAVFGALVGYYVLYYLGVLQRTRVNAALAVGK